MKVFGFSKLFSGNGAKATSRTVKTTTGASTNSTRRGPLNNKNSKKQTSINAQPPTRIQPPTRVQTPTRSQAQNNNTIHGNSSIHQYDIPDDMTYFNQNNDYYTRKNQYDIPDSESYFNF